VSHSITLPAHNHARCNHAVMRRFHTHTQAPAAAAAPAEAPAAGGSGGGGSSGVPEGVEYSEVAMPALSSTMTEGKIVQWLKSPGDKVRAALQLTDDWLLY
jgi:hypothetical protein